MDVKKSGQTVSKIVGADVFVSPPTCRASVQLGLDSTLMRTVSRSCVELEKDRLEISSREKLTLFGLFLINGLSSIFVTILDRIA